MNDDILSVNNSTLLSTDYSFLNTWICDNASGYYNYNITTNTIEKNSNELKINIKKSQIKFNFNL